MTAPDRPSWIRYALHEFNQTSFGETNELNNKTPPTRAAIYVRFAEEQFNLASLQDQERCCREFIAEQSPSWAVADDSIFHDFGGAGLTGPRPGLDTLLKRASETPRPFDYVVVDTFAVLGHSLSGILRVMAVLEYHSVGVHVVALNIDPTRAGLSNLVIAMFESEYLLGQRPQSICSPALPRPDHIM